MSRGGGASIAAEGLTRLVRAGSHVHVLLTVALAWRCRLEDRGCPDHAGAGQPRRQVFGVLLMFDMVIGRVLDAMPSL